MKKVLTICVLVFAVGQTANADVWKWVDTLGNTHFVDTTTPIYTWIEDGRVHYADHPDHEDAVSAELVWHSKGAIEGGDDADEESGSGYAFAGETAEQRAERERAEAYYCQRAVEIYESYLNAPQLYKTNEDGEREYLSKADAARTIAETRAKKDELCE